MSGGVNPRCNNSSVSACESRKSWKLTNFCEIDKYAAKSYCAIHNTDEKLNLGDITRIDETSLEPFNMICGGSPCQDFSVAGQQKGSLWTCCSCGHMYNPLTAHWSERDKCPHCHSTDIMKTRSSLLVEFLRIVRANKPNFGIYENVKNIVRKKFKGTFKMFTDELNEYGYNVYYKVLNAKDYGVPQNRERVYLLFIKKDLDNGNFTFPESFDNGIRLKDVLESEVDEKYYLSEDKVKRFITSLNSKLSLLYDASQVGREDKAREYNDYAPTLTSRDYKDPRLVNENAVKQVGNIVSTGNWDNPIRGRIYSADGISPTLNTCNGGQREPKIVCGIDKSTNNTRCIDYANCITAREDRGISSRQAEGTAVAEAYDLNSLRIRKLTPKECFRLMGFDDTAYEAVSEAGISNAQMYKQCGNSIVVDVLYHIYTELYKSMPYLFNDLRLASFFSGIGAFEVALDRLYEGIDTGNFTQPQAEMELFVALQSI